MKRKIIKYLQDWKAQKDRKPLIVNGARQVGKTYSVREFGQSYASFIEINFITHPEYKRIFENGYAPDDIIKSITLINRKCQIIPNDTLIFFDELQEFPDCTTSLKFFKEDGRYDVICSGSLMGLNYKEITSNSVGYKTDVTLYSLDFEEYLWALGYTEAHVDDMQEHLISLTPFSSLELETYFKIFTDYVITGGMPEVVNDFLEQGNFSNTLALQKQLCLDYEQDIIKYAVGIEKARIRNVYRNIPVFLAKENKKFQISKVAPDARSRNYRGSVDWLCDAGIVHRCYALNHPELPLKGNYDELKFKLYFHDNGLLMASLDEESSDDLRRNRNFGVYKGAIYENIIAEALVKCGLPLYYYKKENAQLEMDFFIRDAEHLIPIEVKAKNGSTISLNNLIHSASYPHITFGIKLSNNNIGYNGRFYTFPYFCAFLLKKWLSHENR